MTLPASSDRPAADGRLSFIRARAARAVDALLILPVFVRNVKWCINIYSTAPCRNLDCTSL